MTLLFSYSHSLPTPSNSSSQALHQQTVPPDSHSWPRSGSLFFLYVVREHRYSTARWAYVEVGSLLGHGCPPGSQWQQKGKLGCSLSLSGCSFQWIKADYSVFWLMELLICSPKHRYLQQAKQEFEERGEQGHFPQSRELLEPVFY